jgi:putative membrane protein
LNPKASSLTSLGVSVALIAMVILFLFYLGATPWAGPVGWHGPHHGWMMGGDGMGIIMLIFWVMVIAAIVLLISGAVANRRPRNGDSPGPPALDILKQRYARGEIDREKY